MPGPTQRWRESVFAVPGVAAVMSEGAGESVFRRWTATVASEGAGESVE